MARSRHLPLGLPINVVNEVLNNINLLKDKYILATTSSWGGPDHNLEWLMSKMFEPSVLEKCRTGYEVCSHYNRLGREQYEVYDKVHMVVAFTDTMLTPSARFVINKEPILVKYCQEVDEILYMFAKVEYVFGWFTHNAKAGAIREYCPWVNSLLSFKNQIPEHSRCTPPNCLKFRLSLIREVASIIASALLIQGCQETQTKRGINLVFNKRCMVYNDLIEIIVPEHQLSI